MKFFRTLVFFSVLCQAAIGRAQTFDVDIRNLAFNPQNITIPVGATVRWTNNEVISTHTVTADDFSFDSGLIPPHQQFSLTFGTPGVYPYHCDLHFSMTGTITVSAPATEVVPSGFSVFRGRLVSGGLSSLITSDNDKMNLKMGPVLGSETPITLDVAGTSSTTSGSQLMVEVEMLGSRTGLKQLIHLWNYQASQWDLVDTRAATTTDSVAQVTITGGANVAKYIKNDGSMAVRIGMQNSGGSQPKLFNAQIDRVHWTITL